MKIKTERVNSELGKQITAIISNDIKDPRLGGAIIGVTKVYTTLDLKYAKVYLSVYAADEDARTQAYNTVCRSKTFIKNKLKSALDIRLIPELVFLMDDSVDYGMKIESILAKIKNNDAENTDKQD